MGCLKLAYYEESQALEQSHFFSLPHIVKSNVPGKNSINYFPYGKVIREFANGEIERYLTTFHDRDQETGLDYRGARYYDSDIGRFLSVDPLANKFPDQSSFHYAGNNPVLYMDFHGLFKLPKVLQTYNPNLTIILKNLEKVVSEDPKILKTMTELTGLSDAEVMNIIKWDSGPTLNIGELEKNVGGWTDDLGEITISEKLISILEGRVNSDNENVTLDVAAMMVFVTVLHEGVHYGDILTNGKNSKGELGNKFEKKAFGMRFDPDNSEAFKKENSEVTEELLKVVKTAFKTKEDEQK